MANFTDLLLESVVGHNFQKGVLKPICVKSAVTFIYVDTVMLHKDPHRDKGKVT